MSMSKFRKLIIGSALALVVAFSASTVACGLETDHPKAEITYEFNGEEYIMEYTLYRNMYPNTVRHFIELAKEGFYDNTVIHNYTSTDWYAGGYGYNAEEYSAAISNSSQSSAMSEYLEERCLEDAYASLFADGTLKPSVYGNISYEGTEQKISDEDKLPTLIGEFKDNINQVIENGALSAEFGALKMFYYTKETAKKVYVTPTRDQTIQADYKYNCATSLFAVQTGSSSSVSADKYCVFATLESVTAFNDFLADIAEWFEDHDDTINVTVNVDNNEKFSEEAADTSISQTFRVPVTPIVVKSVKITRY